MKMTGIIFSNIYDDTLGELTAKRTVASLPFGGRYRQIDFTLSNMVNSGIRNIGVVTKYNYLSLMDHLGNCQEWDLNNKNGGLYIIPPFASGRSEVYRGKLEALHTAMPFLKAQNADYVILSDTITICNIDYKKVLDAHVKSGKDITVIATKPNNYTDDNLLVIDTDESLSAKEIIINYPAKAGALAGMGMFVMDREMLIKEVAEAVAEGFYHFEKDFLQRHFNSGRLSVNVYEFGGKVLRNKNIASFFNNNFALLDEETRNDIFKTNSPIYTKVRDEIPTYYGEGSAVSECLIADGCSIEGEVKESILFRNIKIKKGAKIKKAIIMQGANIGENVYIENAILDKDVTVTDGTRLIGAADSPVIIKKGEIV